MKKKRKRAHLKRRDVLALIRQLRAVAQTHGLYDEGPEDNRRGFGRGAKHATYEAAQALRELLDR